MLCLEQRPIPLPGEDTAPTDVDQVLDAARRLVAAGAVGHDDEHGGYLVARYDLPAAFRR